MPSDDCRRIRSFRWIHDRLCRHVDRVNECDIRRPNVDSDHRHIYTLRRSGRREWLAGCQNWAPKFYRHACLLYILRGLTIFAAIATTQKTIIGGVREAAEGDWLAPIFGGKILKGLFQWMGEAGWITTFTRGTRAGDPVVDGIPMLIVWALVLIAFGHIVLTRTRFGNWIFAVGGDAQAARYAGVPVTRVKIMMFMFTAFCATVFATAQVIEFGSAGADRGLLKEFEAIISVVIGGALLTGGYGSVIGAALGALIFGVVQQGLFFAGVESSLFRVFLGVILLFAVILNTYIRRLITGEK
jgi:simple sugar transport system permease protein